MAINKSNAKVIAITTRQKQKQADSHKALVSEWFQRDRARLISYARRMLPPNLSAEDVVQEIFTKLMAHADLSLVANPSAYMISMARNCVIDYLRRNRESQRVSDTDNEAEGDDEENTLQYSEMMVEIEKALNDLPERCREVFILSRYKGLKTSEIAEQLAISPRMVQKHLVIAFDHFRERLVSQD